MQVLPPDSVSEAAAPVRPCRPAAPGTGRTSCPGPWKTCRPLAPEGGHQTSPAFPFTCWCSHSLAGPRPGLPAAQLPCGLGVEACSRFCVCIWGWGPGGARPCRTDDSRSPGHRSSLGVLLRKDITRQPAGPAGVPRGADETCVSVGLLWRSLGTCRDPGLAPCRLRAVGHPAQAVGWSPVPGSRSFWS